ncbi:MAG: C1 family peptidase [Oculatellaceae cyanobacterium bins.114]|nr:C1 family peptidase [Oculatellaceae cyanobacterium bins.114]
MVKKLPMGWLRDYPDFRDYTPEHDKIQPLLEKVGVAPTPKLAKKDLPSSVDLRAWFPPIEDQGNIGSCTANAGVALVEYFEKRACGKHIDASRLFLYKVTRKLLNFEGDTGAFLRTTIGAMALFGVPPEQYWAYTDDPQKYDEEPPAFCYAFAQNYQALHYFRLDPPGYPKDKLVIRIKDLLSCNIPSMFGFSVYSSMWDAVDGKIPFPSTHEKLEGGHAIVAVGYDDKMTITNPNPGGPTTKGAFLIRNSWGESWGDRGYGWLPYEYVAQGLADDWWSLLKAEWVDTEPFLSET